MEDSGKPALSTRKKGIILSAFAAIIVVGILLTFLLSPTLSLSPIPKDTDSDGYPDEDDAFPTYSSQWSDVDYDGFGDNLNGITPDLFPTDYTQWFDFDHDGYGDNQNGTNPDAFPADPTQWSDLDHDGYGDNQNGTNPDVFPSNSLEWKDTDSDNHGDNSDAYLDNPNYWSIGHATINVEIVSNHTFTSVAYGIYIDGSGRACGYIEPGARNAHCIQIEFPIGVTYHYTVEVKASSTGGACGLETDIEYVVVEPGLIYSIRLII